MATTETLDPWDDDQYASFHTAYLAAHDHEWDRPYSAKGQRAELIDASVYVETTGVLARDGDGVVVGVGIIEVPQRDNLDAGYVEVCVVPEHRRTGYGSALLTQLSDVASRAGRQTLFAEVRWDRGPVTGWCARGSHPARVRGGCRRRGVPGGHPGACRAPRSWAGPVAQGGSDARVRRPAPREVARPHLERRGQRAHDRGQRGHGVRQVGWLGEYVRER